MREGKKDAEKQKNKGSCSLCGNKIHPGQPWQQEGLSPSGTVQPHPAMLTHSILRNSRHVLNVHCPVPSNCLFDSSAVAGRKLKIDDHNHQHLNNGRIYQADNLCFIIFFNLFILFFLGWGLILSLLAVCCNFPSVTNTSDF